MRVMMTGAPKSRMLTAIEAQLNRYLIEAWRYPQPARGPRGRAYPLKRGTAGELQQRIESVFIRNACCDTISSVCALGTFVTAGMSTRKVLNEHFVIFVLSHRRTDNEEGFFRATARCAAN
jgi:hypothetical protein